ncbi:MAG: diguanylate cyclase [Aliarcobacter sp.]|nr:diguanylate cyclase [Aliarcobacter sp.]
MSQQNFQKYFIIYFIIFGIVISSFGSITSYMFQINDIHKSTNKKAQEIFEIKIETILKPALKNMNDVVLSLANNETILEFMCTNNSHKEKELEQIFLAITSSQDKIMQARLLSKDGKEIIRVDRNKENGQAFLVGKEKLQDKSSRDYFQEVSKMTKQTIWHSKLDLNIENGKVEIPHKPTIRIAMPLFENSDFIGMVIINLLADDLLTSIGKSSAFEHFIIDKDNNYILHPNDHFSFNKYKEIKRDLKEDFPNGLDAEGIYSFPLGNIFSNDNAIFVLKTKGEYEKSLIDAKIKTAVIVFLLTIILSFILAIYIAKGPIKLQNALLKAHDKLNEFASIIDKYIITATTKKDSTIISVSSAFVESSGYSKDELIGQKMNIINYPDKEKNFFKELWDSILNGKTWNSEIKNKRKDGEAYWLEQRIIPTLNEDNEIETFVTLGVDITAKKQLEELASIDKLTGLYNRRMIDEFINIEVETHKRNPYDGLSVIMIDIDYFKKVNDTYGHQTGDMVLIQTAKLMMENSRKSDIKGRFGGEEFIIICPQTTAESALRLAEKIRIAIESFKFEEVGYKTISLGISTFEDNDTVESLIKKADTALYEAKNSGRNKSVIFK